MQKRHSVNSMLIALLLPLSAFFCQSIMATEVIGRHIFGLARDFQHAPLIQGEDPLIFTRSPSEVTLSIGTQAFVVSLFEETIGGVYVTALSNSETQPQPQRVDTWALESGPVRGLSQPLSPHVSPWNTVLFSETNALDVTKPDAFVKDFRAYFKNQNEAIKPYHYGWLGEVVLLDAQGQAKLIKNYAAGRIGASHMAIMPDQKTFYFLDGDHSGHLFVFIAEQAGSLAKGRLYGVVNKQGKAHLHKLGDAPALKMKFKLRRASFGDFFNSSTPQNGQCQAPFQAVQSRFGLECLQAVKKNQKYRGQFEPVRSLAYENAAPILPQAVDLSFNEAQNALTLRDQQGKSHRLSLQAHPQLQSDFITGDFL